MYRLDRTAFKAQTAEQATKSHSEFYKQLTWQERLKIANYLNSIAFNYPEQNPPRLDRTAFSASSRKECGQQKPAGRAKDLDDLENL
jgi:hypothetical protein